MIIDVFLSEKREEFIEQRSLCSLLSECFERCCIEKVIIITVLSRLRISVLASGCSIFLRPLSFPHLRVTYTMSAELPSRERVTCGVSVSLRKPEGKRKGEEFAAKS